MLEARQAINLFPQSGSCLLVHHARRKAASTVGADMKISELIMLAENRLSALNQAMITAIHFGDIEAIARIGLEVEETQSSLDLLKTLI